MSELTDPDELFNALEAWGALAKIRYQELNGNVLVFRNDNAPSLEERAVARKHTFNKILPRLIVDNDCYRVPAPEDRFDFHILKTLKDIQDEDEDGVVNCSGVYRQFVDCEFNKRTNGKLIVKSETHVGNRVLDLIERSLIIQTTGISRDVTCEPFHACVKVTSKGQHVLRNGLRALNEDGHKPLSKDVHIGNLHTNQAHIGDVGNQRLSQTNHIDTSTNVTVGQLLRAVIVAIDEAQAPPELKEDAKSALLKFRDSLGATGQSSIVGNTVVDHIPAFLSTRQQQ